jgi:Ca2+-binding RTX toxin-like protein
MTQILNVPFHARRPLLRLGRDALCALAVAAVVLGALALVLASEPASATQYVDKTGRYILTDSNEPGGPTFNPITVSTDLHLSDDGEATVNLPFPFTFYGTEHTTASVGANGAVAFPAPREVGNINYRLDQFTGTLVAPWWDDWDPSVHGQVLTGVVGQYPRRTFVVWWKDVAHGASAPGDGYASFQLHLFEGTNRVEFHYLRTTVAVSPYGGAGTVGIDNGNTSLLQYSFNQQVLRNGRAIRFERAMCDGLEATVLGSPGADTINTGSGDDVIVALGGNDHINSGPGVDIVCAGRGNDVVEGGYDADHLLGGNGLDQLIARSGDDLLEGGPGIDHLAGGGGHDICRGGTGNDTASLCEVKAGLP